MAQGQLCWLRGTGQPRLVTSILCLTISVGARLPICVIIVAVGVAVTRQVARGHPTRWVQQVQIVLGCYICLRGGDDGDMGPQPWGTMCSPITCLASSPRRPSLATESLCPIPALLLSRQAGSAVSL